LVENSDNFRTPEHNNPGAGENGWEYFRAVFFTGDVNRLRVAV